MDLQLLVQKLAVWALPVIFAVTVREIARGIAARQLGDKTATMMGRLSLNPLSHVDPVGTLLVPGILILLGSFLMGWAKPIPIDIRNFKNPRRDIAIVSATALMSGLIMAVAWGLLYKYAAAIGATSGVWYGITQMAEAGLLINLALFVLNLIPLPPLDGGQVAVGLLPHRAAYNLAKVEPYTAVALIVLMVFGILGKILAIPFGLLIFVFNAFLGINIS